MSSMWEVSAAAQSFHRYWGTVGAVGAATEGAYFAAVRTDFCHEGPDQAPTVRGHWVRFQAACLWLHATGPGRC